MVAVIESAHSGLVADVVEALRKSSVVGKSNIRVTEADGSVVLSGVVDSYARKLAAQATTEALSGTRAVVNEIEVGRDGVYGWRDVDLIDGARTIFRSHFLLAGKGISVSAWDGVLKLLGRVETLAEKTAAEHALACLPSLRGIRNEIVVVPPRVSPEVISSEARAALRRVLGPRAERVDIRVAGARVTLGGFVGSHRDEHAAIEALETIAGVAEIANELSVSPDA